MEFRHVSVLLQESIQLLNVKESGTYADGTLGGGGHAAMICERLSPAGCLVGIDRDVNAIRAASARLAVYPCKKVILHDNFFHIKTVLAKEGIRAIDGMILDLGVSSPQLDDGARGFSYHRDARLDMRMDQEAVLDAFQVVNGYTEAALADLIFRYGEEKRARVIAKEIVKARKDKPIETTLELAEVIKRVFPPAARFSDKHPAKRTFQAIRIEVNQELEGLQQAILDIVSVLKENGRLAVITFHSLEDRIVKQTFADLAQGCICPKEFPVCVCGRQPKARLITKKPVVAGAEEIEENSRAHSAKLRVLEKI